MDYEHCDLELNDVASLLDQGCGKIMTANSQLFMFFFCVKSSKKTETKDAYLPNKVINVFFFWCECWLITRQFWLWLTSCPWGVTHDQWSGHTVQCSCTPKAGDVTCGCDIASQPAALFAAWNQFISSDLTLINYVGMIHQKSYISTWVGSSITKQIIQIP